MSLSALTVRVTPAGLVFDAYPFPAASIAVPGSLLPWPDVVTVALTRAPPEVRTTAGETLFVSGVDEDALRAAATAQGIPVVTWEDGDHDVWDMLLEPFLDTAFTPENEAALAVRLAALGLDARQVAGLRAEHGDAMIAYNIDSGLWDWVHLGLYDLLCAYRGDLAGERFRLPEPAFAAVYAQAQAIARRGWAPVSPRA